MVIDHCTHIIQTWMIHHFDQRVTADAKMYHTWLYDKCTIIYDHICTPFWRSVSASGHGNLILNMLPRPTRVRSRPPQWPSLALRLLTLLVDFLLLTLTHFKMIQQNSPRFNKTAFLLLVMWLFDLYMGFKRSYFSTKERWWLSRERILF